MEKRFGITILIAILIALGLFIWMSDSEDAPENMVGDEYSEVEVSSNTSRYEIDAKIPSGNTPGAREVKKYIEGEINNFKENAQENTTRFPHTFDSLVDIHTTSEYFSYVITIGEYTGGANANQRVKTFVFDTNSKEEVDLSDVVSDEELVLEDVKAELYDTEGTFKDQVDELTVEGLKNFFVEDDSLTFLFSKYEVAPGAAGIVRVSISR